MDRSAVHYKEKLQSVWGSIKKDVRLSDISDSLVESGALSVELWEELKSSHLSEKDRMEKFLFALIKSNSVANFQAFVDALKNTGFRHISAKLQSKETGAPILHLTGHHFHTQTDSTSNRGGASGEVESASTMKERVTTLEQLMERLEMIYEKQEETQRQVERQGQKADLVFSEQQRQFGILQENNDAIKNQMENITTDIENKFDAMQEYNEKTFGTYELLKKRHDELLEENMKKERELKDLQAQLENLESNPQVHFDDRFTTLQTQFIGLKEKNEERVVRLKNLNLEIKAFLKKFAETFSICVPHPQHLREIEEHFQSVQDRMQKLKSDNDSLMVKLQKLVEENENLIIKNRKMEEEMANVDKKKSKIEENLRSTKDSKNDRCLRLKGKKCH